MGEPRSAPEGDRRGATGYGQKKPGSAVQAPQGYHRHRLAHRDEMTARWQAGEFDHLYGPYRAKGIVVEAPPKAYVELPEKGGAKGAGQGRAGDV